MTAILQGSGESTDRIDMQLNPDKITQYKLDVRKTENDIRDEHLDYKLSLYSYL